jgi:hypothetical protein
MTKTKHMTKTKKKSVSIYKTITITKNKSKSKKYYNYTKKHNSSINKQKTLRIIFVDSQGLQNDATIYENEFIKQGYKVDVKLIENINHNPKEKYYDVNLFLEVLPFKYKILFPSTLNLFMPNNEIFIDTNGDNKLYGKRDKYGKVYTYNRYQELKSIDFILCKTQICYNFFNFIKNEKKNSMKETYTYKFQTIYTKFTSSIMKELQDSHTLQDPNLFIHLAGKSSFKNTPELILCWIKNKGFLDIDPDIKLVITCFGDCYKLLNSSLKYWHKYDFEKDPDVNINHKTNIATYKNMTIYFKPIEPLSLYNDIISSASVAICISNKEGYGHYINESRYLNKFIITMDYPPMNELVKDKDDKDVKNGEGNGILLKKRNKFNKKTYKETKFNFYEAYPDMNELRDSIIWCIKHKNELRTYSKNGKKMFMDDKKYFEDSMEKFIRNKL